jgi:hypothetical protein
MPFNRRGISFRAWSGRLQVPVVPQGAGLLPDPLIHRQGHCLQADLSARPRAAGAGISAQLPVVAPRACAPAASEHYKHRNLP